MDMHAPDADWGDTQTISPEAWATSFAPRPQPLLPLDGGALCHYQGTSAVMEQPPLDHHYLAMHLGGGKHVRRQGDGATIDMPVNDGSITVVPAGSAFRWHTRGPIDFAHLYIAPRRLARTLRDTFDRDPGNVDLRPTVGWDDPATTGLMRAMLDPVLAGSSDGRLARDAWFEALLVRLLYAGSTLDLASPRARNSLAPRTLTRLKTHIEAHLAEALTLDDLAAVAGLSRFHLCRAFRDATGLPPHAYLTRERVARARRLLRTTAMPVADIAKACGFASPNQFATTFRKHVGVTPTLFRRDA